MPFAYSIMHRSHPVQKSKLEAEFIEKCLASRGTGWTRYHTGLSRECSGLRYKDVLPLLDYFTINIYPFLSCGVRGVAMENLTGPEMNFLNDQISALRCSARQLDTRPSLSKHRGFGFAEVFQLTEVLPWIVISHTTTCPLRLAACSNAVCSRQCYGTVDYCTEQNDQANMT